MKKITLLLASAALAFSASAASKYVVWSGDELTAQEEQLPIDWYGWWNCSTTTIEDATSAEGASVYWHAADNSGDIGKNCSAGIYIGDNGHRFDMSQLAPMDLVFNAKVVGSGDWTVRLTGLNTGDVDCALATAADGEWHEVRLNIADKFAGVYPAWMQAATDEAYMQGYVFALIGSNLTPDAAVYLSDIHYEASVEMPVITASASSITSDSAVLAYEVAFPEGYTNTSVTVNGNPADAAATLNLTGLDAKTTYTYTIVATGDFGGKTYTAEKAVVFTTLREIGDVPTYYGTIDGTCTQEGTTYNVHVDYYIAYNADKTVTVYAEFAGLPDNSGHKVNLQNGADDWALMTQEGDGWIYTSTGTFDEGQLINLFFWCEYPMGVFGGEYHILYNAGTETEKPVTAPRVKSAVAQNVTFDSAEIAYEIYVPAELAAADVKVFVGEKQYTDLAGVAVISGLAEHTAYEVEVYAVATLGSDVYESAHKTVSFTTPYKDAKDLVYADYVKARFNNAFRVGETEADRRVITASLPFTLTYTATGNLVYSIDVTEVADIVGLVPQIWCDGFKNLSEGADHVWSYDFGAREAGSAITISHYLAYAGGAVDINFGAQYNTVGQEQALPVLGEAAAMELTAAKKVVKVGEENLLIVIVTDPAGYYLAADAVDFTAPAGLTIDGGKAVASARGTYEIVAKAGALESRVTVVCGMSEAAEELAHGIEAYDFSPAQEGADIKWITDGNDGDPEVIWACGETEAHHVYLDLGNVYFVECVAPVWEGAYAAEYKVLLSPEVLPGDAFAVEVAGNNTTTPVHVLEAAVPARYVGIETSKALNTGWGIKLRELRVYGTTEPTGIADIIDFTDGEAEYYNLNGMRVSGNLTPGIYIMRQGSKVVKMIVR